MRDLALRSQMSVTPTEQASEITTFLTPSFDAAFWPAERIGSPSAWWGHVAFGQWIVCAARPRLLVELGTRAGVSYSAFCQSVLHASLDTRCYAVDTWRGGPHAGFDSEEVFTEFSQFHDERYGAFSTLLRMTFDEARDRFADGSIDLLHIDGYHTYDTVQQDFDSWRCKLSERAVVLLHDTNVRRDDFGGRRLWTELKTQFPHFEFLHSLGLGVLAFGERVPSEILALCQISEPFEIAAVRGRFAALGERALGETRERMLARNLARVQQLINETEARATAAEVQVREAAEAQGALEKALRKAEARAAAAEARTEEGLDAHRKLEETFCEAQERVSAAEARALESRRQSDRRLAEARQDAHDANTRAEQAHASAFELQIERDLARQERELVLSSTIWRATWPLRIVGRKLPSGVRRVLRAGLKLGWWSLTLKLPRKLRELSVRYYGAPVGSVQFLRGLAGKGLRQLVGDGFVRVLRPAQRQLQSPVGSPDDVARNIFARQQSELTAEQAEQMLRVFPNQPLISVIMPVYKTPVQWLRRAVESLQQQYYGRWELCAVDDCSPTDEQRNLLQELTALDVRVRFKVMDRNGGISAASNAALEMARGEYVALLDHDDELTPDALFRVVEAINRQPDLDFLYSDECKVDDTPARKLFAFRFKPDWSAEIMFNGMLTGHLTVYRKALVDEVGRFRSQYDFSQDYDLALRIAEAAKRIVHIERVLYLWRAIPGSAACDGKDFARASNIAALNDALLRRNIPGKAIPLPHANCVRIALPARAPLVSIIVPSDSLHNLRSVLPAIRDGTDYTNYEIVVVCNTPLAERLKDEFHDWETLRFVHYNRKFNFSDKCNEGARAAGGEIVVFYNDDVFPMQRDWIERLIEYLWVPGVGGVSPKLLHADNTIQYAGMISGTPGLCGTAYNNVPNETVDSFLTMHRYVRNVSILSGACCAFRKDVFWEVGAFDAVNTPDGHSDMDLSYKLIESSYRCVYTPHSLLRHIGNRSWDAKRHKYKADIFALKRWGALVSTDPCFTDNMKSVLYHDFRFPFRIYAEHIDPKRCYSGPDVLFVSHDLSLTGAPRMLFNAAKLIRQNGGFPVVVSPIDGPLREELVRAGIVVIIDESVRHDHFLFERFARNFDLAVVNTVEMVEAVRQLSAIPILRTVWWLHEAELLSQRLRDMPSLHWERVHALCISEYARGFVPEGIDVEVIGNGIPDERGEPAADDARPLTFLLSGTIEPRKGQDILVDAVALLPPEVRQQCRFVLTGKLWEPHRDFWGAIEARMQALPEIAYLGILDHQSQLQLMASADVAVCCSRDEPSSLVVMEAAMLGKPAILSDRVGLREVFDEESCFVFASESADSLAAQFFAAYENREALKRMGMAARRVFERRLTLEAFGKSFLALVSEQIAESAPSASSEDGPKHHDRVIRCVIPNDRGEDCHMDPRAAEFLGALDPNTRILGLGRSPMATR